MAIEFTLTAKALGVKGDGIYPNPGTESLRCRVLLLNDGTTVACWRARNVLDEEIWLGGSSDHCGPSIGGVHVTREHIIWWAMRTMAERINRDRCLETKELPNGAIVFDLGTV